jgi:hypothetical protein
MCGNCSTPTAFPLQITEFDQYLFGEGTHYRTYEKMGAHPIKVNGVEGVHFRGVGAQRGAGQRDWRV